MLDEAGIQRDKCSHYKHLSHHYHNDLEYLMPKTQLASDFDNQYYFADCFARIVGALEGADLVFGFLKLCLTLYSALGGIYKVIEYRRCKHNICKIS